VNPFSLLTAILLPPPFEQLRREHERSAQIELAKPVVSWSGACGLIHVVTGLIKAALSRLQRLETIIWRFARVED
jgi:hypothetical protein